VIFAKVQNIGTVCNSLYLQAGKVFHHDLGTHRTSINTLLNSFMYFTLVSQINLLVHNSKTFQSSSS